MDLVIMPWILAIFMFIEIPASDDGVNDKLFEFLDLILN